MKPIVAVLPTALVSLAAITLAASTSRGVAPRDTETQDAAAQGSVVAAIDSDAAEVTAIERAAMDYIEAFYEAKPELLERSVSKALTKYGYWRENAESEYRGSAMTFDSAVALAKSWNAKGWLAKDAPKSVKILDRFDKIAAVKVTAHWGADYMHLEKVDGKWVIRHVIWQSVVPPTKKADAGK